MIAKYAKSRSRRELKLKRRSTLLKLVCIATCLIHCTRAATCLEEALDGPMKARLPKVLLADCDSAACTQSNVYTAIAANEQSIFVGGSIQQDNLSEASDPVAALTRIDTDFNIVIYTMTYSTEHMELINSLSLSPDNDYIAIGATKMFSVFGNINPVPHSKFYVGVAYTIDGSIPLNSSFKRLC